VTSPRVGVLDYGSGNLHSVRHALEAAGADVVVTADRPVLETCDGLVVPGVGAFAACLAGLARVGGDQLISVWLAAARRPLLGICVGHQALFARGIEHGVDTPGLGFLPGAVEPLTSRRLPHMGWNLVTAPPGSRMFAGVAGQRFYFVHSYAVHHLTSPDVVVTTCEHDGDTFVAAVEAGLAWSTQFHPEKSGAAGARLLGNWLAEVRRVAGIPPIEDGEADGC